MEEEQEEASNRGSREKIAVWESLSTCLRFLNSGLLLLFLAFSVTI